VPKIRRFIRQLASAEGVEILEAALVLPLVFLFLLGIVEFGRLFNIYSTIQQAAQKGALTAARSTCATSPCSDNFPTKGVVADAVKAVMNASNVDPNQIAANPNPPTPISCVNPPALATCFQPSNITICSQVLLNSPYTPPAPSQCGTLVSFKYPFTFTLPFTSLNFQTITLTVQAQSRMEN
jgi:hypothetical protein